MRKAFYCAVCFLALAMIGCKDESTGGKAIVGAWKSVQADSITGKPVTLIISENRLTIDGQSAEVSITEVNGVILVKLAGTSDTILRATPQQQGQYKFANMAFDKIFTPSTEAEVKSILAEPSKLKSKPDPF